MGILNPEFFDVHNDTIYEWRQFLKFELLKKRNWKSDFSGKELKECHMHEGIIPRRMAPKNLWWHYKIFSEYNSILLLPSEHIPQPPSRQWCYNYLCNLYTPDIIDNWIASLPFKIKVDI